MRSRVVTAVAVGGALGVLTYMGGHAIAACLRERAWERHDEAVLLTTGFAMRQPERVVIGRNDRRAAWENMGERVFDLTVEMDHGRGNGQADGGPSGGREHGRGDRQLDAARGGRLWDAGGYA